MACNRVPRQGAQTGRSAARLAAWIGRARYSGAQPRGSVNRRSPPPPTRAPPPPSHQPPRSADGFVLSGWASMRGKRATQEDTVLCTFHKRGDKEIACVGVFDGGCPGAPPCRAPDAWRA